jgi:hypothetical protein
MEGAIAFKQYDYTRRKGIQVGQINTSGVWATVY